MELLLLGVGMGLAGGLFPSPLHMIALAQVALKRWLRALFILIGAPLVIDGALLVITFFFYQHIPRTIAHNVAYVGGSVVIAFGLFSLAESRKKTREEMASSAALSYGGVTAAALAEIAAPGTWIYWLTLAGPIIAEGGQKGYWHVVPFFAGGLIGYYGAALLSLCFLAWGASLHRQFKQHLFVTANVLLVLLGISYLVRAQLYDGR
jgi:hypothetical protein